MSTVEDAKRLTKVVYNFRESQAELLSSQSFLTFNPSLPPSSPYGEPCWRVERDLLSHPLSSLKSSQLAIGLIAFLSSHRVVLPNMWPWSPVSNETQKQTVGVLLNSLLFFRFLITCYFLFSSTIHSLVKPYILQINL